MENNLKDIKKKTVTGLMWRFGERITAQLISFIVSIILARILLPQEYGIIAIVTIFINIANVFVTSGLGTSLVQVKKADEIDFSTMFWASIFLSVILYTIIFLISPVIAKIYQNDLLVPVLRIMGLKLPISAFSSIQQAYVQRKMIYKKFFFATIIGTIISAFVGIIMALKGFGVWSLVAQYLSNSVIDTIVLFCIIDWKPKLIFSINRFKPLFSYGWKVMMTSLLGSIFDQLRGFIIGAKYTTVDLAYNNKGEQFPKFLSNNINSTVESVLLSSLSKFQDDKENIKKAMRRTIRLFAFIIIPMLLGLFGIAETFIKILLTEKWLPSVPYLRAVCLGECFSIISLVNLQVLKAIGRSDMTLKLELIKKPIYLTIILLMLPISPLAICIGNAVYSIVALLINTKPNIKILNYSLKEQFGDILAPLVVSIFMSVLIMIIGLININIYIKFIVQIIFGVSFYITVCKIIKLDSYDYLKNIIKSLLNRRGVKNA